LVKVAYSGRFETVWETEHERKSEWGHRVFSLALILGYPILSILYYLNNHSHFLEVFKIVGAASVCFSLVLSCHFFRKLSSQNLAFYNFLLLIFFHSVLLVSIPHASYERSCFHMTVCLILYCMVLRFQAYKALLCTVLVLIFFPTALYFQSSEALARFMREGGVFFFLAQSAFPFIVWQRYTNEKRTFYYQHTLEEQNAQLEEQVAIAQKATKAKTDFLSMMSHEIRTPLNGIVGVVHLLLKENVNSEFQKELIQTLLFSSNHLMAVVNDILDFNKINSNYVKLDHKPFNPATLLEHLKKTFLPKSQSKNLNLVFEIKNVLPHRLVGDEGKLHQIITNLIHNAIKFTESGEVRLSVTELRRTDKLISLSFEVNDTGIGIPKDQQSQIFELFTQADNQNTKKYGGTGLGLAITKELLKLFGSEIKLRSDMGSGTTFSFEVDFEYSDSVPTMQPVQIEASLGVNLTTPRVLVVDDNSINLLLATSFLSKKGIEADTAVDGKEALEKLSNNPFDLILMDLRMPVMNGFECTRLIRKEGSQIPIIALTASAFEDEKERAMAHGFSDYLVKPYLPETFYQMVFKYLDKSKSVEG
jgi:signal transduction histidine kinase/ActR/RegA family two-component response regulator